MAQYEYDALGNTLSVTDASGAPITTWYNIANANPIRYRGYYYDSDLGLYYLQSRYYDATIGRFINTDNITDSGAGVLGYNTFMYCGNNPVNTIDPSGHGRIWNKIKKFLGIETQSTHTSKKEKKVKGEGVFVKYCSGDRTDVTLKTATTQKTRLCNTTTYEDDVISAGLGIESQYYSSSVYCDSNIGCGMSFTTKCGDLNTSLEVSYNSQWTEITFTNYSEFESHELGGQIANGVYHTIYINNHTQRAIKTVVASIVMVALIPESAFVVAPVLESAFA